ncbi:GerAB/ArcD/ProY family transporter [Paenibacillus oceani]|uniref:Endospore germination permease n=1 Tax=Paenibacillus oceani TaxID=2772510 RepID=A0A927H1K1_9BACL|nr:endospore germination permease [Paenibacillus oceani]MBD2865246.1 endospore germination permease [Paenibacillus oceani]
MVRTTGSSTGSGTRTTEDRNKPDKPYLITIRQSSAMIASGLIGVGVLTLTRKTAESAGESGWIVAIGGTMLALAVIIKLSNRHPGQTIVEYASRLLGPRRYPLIGRIVGFPLFLAFFLFWATSTALVARTFGDVVVTTVLTRTPLEVVIATMLITSFIYVMYDEGVVARVNEILLPIIVIPVLVIALSSFQSARIDNLLPVFDGNWAGLMKGIFYTASSYLGFEIMTIFFADTKQGSKRMTGGMVGVAIPGLIYVLIVISSISVFGVEEIRLLAWPTLELVKTSEVPGFILERLESAFLGVWVAAVFTTVGNMYYATAAIARRTFKLKSHRWIALFLLPAYYWFSLVPQNGEMLLQYSRFISNGGMIIAYCVPVLLLFLSFAKGGRKREGQTQSGQALSDQKEASTT